MTQVRKLPPTTRAEPAGYFASAAICAAGTAPAQDVSTSDAGPSLLRAGAGGSAPALAFSAVRAWPVTTSLSLAPCWPEPMRSSQ